MMGQHARSKSLFYYFKLDDYVPKNHLLRLIDEHVSFAFVRERLKDSYSDTGRPSIDPELLLRILLVGYLYGITSERKLVEEPGAGCPTHPLCSDEWVPRVISARQLFHTERATASAVSTTIEMPGIRRGPTHPNPADEWGTRRVGAQGSHPHQPLQQASRMVGRRASQARRSRLRRLRMAAHPHRLRNPRTPACPESRARRRFRQCEVSRTRVKLAESRFGNGAEAFPAFSLTPAFRGWDNGLLG